MGRSNGYRPRKAVEEEVKFWRDKLNACHSSQWQKAGLYMQNITALLGADAAGEREVRHHPDVVVLLAVPDDDALAFFRRRRMHISRDLGVTDACISPAISNLGTTG